MLVSKTIYLYNSERIYSPSPHCWIGLKWPMTNSSIICNIFRKTLMYWWSYLLKKRKLDLKCQKSVRFAHVYSSFREQGWWTMDLQSGQVILHLVTLMGSSKAKLQILHTLSFSSSSKSAAISALSLIDRAGISLEFSLIFFWILEVFLFSSLEPVPHHGAQLDVLMPQVPPSSFILSPGPPETRRKDEGTRFWLMRSESNISHTWRLNNHIFLLNLRENFALM